MKTEVNRFYMDFKVAGFNYHQGIEVIDKLKPGQKVKLKIDADNRFDPRAVKVLLEGKVLGYIPRTHNKEIWQFMALGYPIFEAFISRYNAEEHPQNQVDIVVRIKEKKKKEKKQKKQKKQ